MYLYEIITFGPIVSVSYRRSPRPIGVGSRVEHEGRSWRVDRVEKPERSLSPRLICVEESPEFQEAGAA